MHPSKYNHEMSLLSKLFNLLPHPSVTPSTEEIDVVIMVVNKDLKTLPICLRGVRECVSHPLRNIYIVAPNDQEIKDFCKKNDVTFVEEGSVLGITPKDINLKVTTKGGDCDRSGWLFQQLLKLSGKIGTCDNYLCVDADHVLLQPHAFITDNGKFVMYTNSREHHKAYYRAIKKITSIRKISLHSYVAHKMLFNKEMIEQLHAEIETTTGMPWIDAIIKNYDRNELSGFSEFELYGNFICDKVTLPWKEKELTYDYIESYTELKSLYGTKHRAVTFPEWKNSKNNS